MKAREAIAAALLAIAAAGSAAQARAEGPASAATAAAKTEGEIRKVDKEAVKVTIKHGPIANLGMPPMTMVFRVADPKMLDALSEGDKVRFTVDRAGGALTITEIEPVK